MIRRRRKGVLMTTFKKNGFVRRVAFRSADPDTVPDTISSRDILFLFAVNVAGWIWSYVIWYPFLNLIFITGFLVAKKPGKSTDDYGRLPFIGSGDRRCMRGSCFFLPLAVLVVMMVLLYGNMKLTGTGMTGDVWSGLRYLADIGFDIGITFLLVYSLGVGYPCLFRKNDHR